MRAGCPLSAVKLLACLLAWTLSVHAGSLGTDLVLYLPLDSVATDQGFHAVDLEVEGNPTGSSDAQAGTSLRFDGSADKVQLMPWRSSDVVPEREHVAVSLWFKADADGANKKRVLFADTGSRGKRDTLAARVNWAITPSKLQATCIRDGKQVSLAVDFSDTTNWQHLVVMKSGDSFSMYLNGVEAASEADLDTAPSSSVNAGVGESFLGRIDEVRIYRRSLTPQDIADLGSTSALSDAAVWRSYYFDETENTGAAADDQDGDSDGSPNLWERATKTSPLEAASVSLPTPLITEQAGQQYLTLRYRRLAGGTGTTGVNYTKDGLTWRVQTRTDLTTGDWTGGATEVEQVGQPVDNGDGTNTVTVRRNVEAATEPVSFMRVGVE